MSRRHEIEVWSGSERYMAVVLREFGKYVLVTQNGQQSIAKRSLGAWRELPLHVVAAMLDEHDRERR